MKDFGFAHFILAFCGEIKKRYGFTQVQIEGPSLYFLRIRPFRRLIFKKEVFFAPKLYLQSQFLFKEYKFFPVFKPNFAQKSFGHFKYSILSLKRPFLFIQRPLSRLQILRGDFSFPINNIYGHKLTQSHPLYVTHIYSKKKYMLKGQGPFLKDFSLKGQKSDFYKVYKSLKTFAISGIIRNTTEKQVYFTQKSGIDLDRTKVRVTNLTKRQEIKVKENFLFLNKIKTTLLSKPESPKERSEIRFYYHERHSNLAELIFLRPKRELNESKFFQRDEMDSKIKRTEVRREVVTTSRHKGSVNLVNSKDFQKMADQVYKLILKRWQKDLERRGIFHV